MRPVPNDNPACILVVDDDVVQRNLIGKLAARAGLAVATAASFESATAQLALRAFSFVTIDLSLGERDGVELLRIVAQLHVKPRVIVVSGCDQRLLQAAVRMGRSIGISDVEGLQKPLDPAAFRAMLGSVASSTIEGDVSAQPALAVSETALVASDLRGGLDRLEFYPVFQPKVDLATGRVSGCEALARWSNSDLGNVSPSEFVALAEQHGHIGALTTTILEQSIEAMPALLRRQPDFVMAVNVSAMLLSDLKLPEAIERMLLRSRVPARALMVEITESVAMSDISRATDVLVRLRLKGVGISIDDFGTGYSSLRALARMPFTELKIDQSFVTGGESEADLWKVVRASVALAHEMGMKAVAEGIEDVDTWRALQAIGCDVGQGFYFCRPLPIADFLDWSFDWNGSRLSRLLGTIGDRAQPGFWSQ